MVRFDVGPRELKQRIGDWQSSADTLYEALASAIEARIRVGELPPGAQLPAERRLAAALDVSRGTVMAAYDRLREQRLVATRHGSGTVVLPDGSPVSGPREAHVTATLEPESIFSGFVNLDQGTIDLRGVTWVGTDDLPEELFERAWAQLRRERGTHGYNVLGVAVLRRAIADHLSRAGLDTDEEEILVTTGGQQAIFLVAQLLVGPRDAVITESSTYPGAMKVLAAQQARTFTVPVDTAGPRLAVLRRLVEQHDPRLVYLIPSVHNPTGVVMPNPARARLAEVAAGWSTTIIDDRSLADTQLDGPVPAPIAAFAGDGFSERIVTIGSLSKSAWAGLRVGWIRASRPMVSRLAKLKSIVDLGTPVASQLAAAEVLTHSEQIFAARREAIRERRQLMEDLLHRHIPDWTWRTPDGGLCLWVDLGDASAADLCHIAQRHGVAIVPGAASSSDPDCASRIRLPYSQPPEVIREAVRRLTAAWDEYGDRIRTCDTDRLSVVV